METVTGRTYEGGESVETDGIIFDGCTFNAARLVYRGGEHPLFESCTFGADVSWIFLGSALKTIQFLQRIANDEGGERFIADIFQKGKYFADA
ncbi:MAG TPA: hypothetical protein VH331_11335 [Allosphingosinicella sp.]|jgi:hypothetical protein|nr:hypothetical protein [Allosphingosinicella sp.]